LNTFLFGDTDISVVGDFPMSLSTKTEGFGCVYYLSRLSLLLLFVKSRLYLLAVRDYLLFAEEPRIYCSISLWIWSIN